MAPEQSEEKAFTRKVVRAYLYFKKNPNALKKGSVAEALFKALENKPNEVMPNK